AGPINPRDPPWQMGKIATDAVLIRVRFRRWTFDRAVRLGHSRAGQSPTWVFLHNLTEARQTVALPQSRVRIQEHDEPSVAGGEALVASPAKTDVLLVGQQPHLR